MSPFEALEVAATAKGLPDSWCLSVEPPYGQLSISPLAERRRFALCHVALPAEGRITRQRAVLKGPARSARPAW